MALLAAFVAGGLMTGHTRAQDGPRPATPQIPQPIFRAPEDVWKYGVKAEDIKPGVRPDYTKLRDPLVVLPVRGNVYMIGGAGANIAMLVTDEGVLLVDAGVEAAADKVITEYKKMTPRQLRWIIDTSVDLDNTGGNEKVSKSIPAAQPAVVAGGLAAAPGGAAVAAGFNGAGAGIMAFENTLNRMSAPTGQAASRPTDAWPTDTFFTARKNIYYGEPIELHHVPAAHTDGDIMVFFRRSDVIASGDLYSTDRFPFVDAEKGGSVNGIIDGLNRLVSMAVPEYNQQGGTRIIPGHGRVSNQTDVVEYRDMATIIRDRMATMVKKGATLDQVKAAHLTLDYDGNYGSTTGTWTTDMFVNELYKELVAANAPKVTPKKK
jgi:cyclase